MKIAVVLTGDVRDCCVRDTIAATFRGHDIFCGSYLRHEPYLSAFCKHLCLINEETDIRLPAGIRKATMQQNMLQWLHLDNVLRAYGPLLRTYDVILKYRFDYQVKGAFLNKISVRPNVMYNESDRVFYSDSATFLRAFKPYYDTLHHYTLARAGGFDINNTWRSELALQLHLKQLHITSARQQFATGQIIRGSYPKQEMDGNQTLYEGGKIKGKFSKPASHKTP